MNAVEPQKETDSKAAYSALADILSDTNSRDALIAELRDSAKTGKPLAEKAPVLSLLKPAMKPLLTSLIPIFKATSPSRRANWTG